MLWRMPLKKQQWIICQLTNFEASNEEIESKIGIYTKNWARYAFSEILTFGQRSTQKVKVNYPWSKSTDTWSRSVPGFRVGSRIRQQICWRHPMTCHWRGLGRAWLLMWHADVERWCHLMTLASVLRRVEGAWRWVPAHGDETNTRRCVWVRKITRFSGQVDRGTIRPSWQRVWLRSELGVENFQWRVW